MDSKIKDFGAYEERCVPIREIDPDRGVQMRDSFCARKAGQYADRYREGTTLPPVVLFYDGTHYFRADGAHRIAGARMANREEIEAHVYQGGRREALLYAAGANADFGLDRTDETIRASVLTLLRDPEWYEWGDRQISRWVVCSKTTVGKYRKIVDEERAAAAKPAPTQPGLFDPPQELVVERDPEEPRVRKGADGRAINTAKIGSAKRQEQEEQRLRELLDQARELGAQDAAKGLRSQGELVRALGACPPGKLEVLWAAYRAALREAQDKAPAKTFRPASEATEALRGKPIGGPPLVPSASNEGEKEDPAEEDETAEDEEAVCRICGKEVCEDEEACLARAEEEDGEDLDEDDGAEEPPRATALSVLGGLVRNLTSDPARKDEVGAELLRLAGELGAQPADGVRILEAERDAAERERGRAELRERALHRRLFDLAAAWRRQGLDGPRADLVVILDGEAEDVAAVLGRTGHIGPRRALPWKALAQALRKRWQVSERNDAAACAELQEARKEIATLKVGAKPAELLRRAERAEAELRALRLREDGPEEEARPVWEVLPAVAETSWEDLGYKWASVAWRPATCTAEQREDPDWLVEVQLEMHDRQLDDLRTVEREVLIRGARTRIQEQEAKPAPVAAKPAKAARVKSPALRSDPAEEVVPDFEPKLKAQPAEEEKRCEKCGCTSEKACEGGCFWVTPTLCSTCAPPKDVVAKVKEISAGQRAKHARALEIATERARKDAAGALPMQRARQSLLHVVAKEYGSMDAALCKKVWAAYQEAWERAKAAPPAPAAAPPAPTWQPASVGGAQAVHALPLGAAADGDHGRHPAALCKQRPNYKSKAGWTPRPGVALTCKGCLAATGAAP